ncbi:MAG: hypothetical protein Kow00124_18660 [Anaerolineae bacterium]
MKPHLRDLLIVYLTALVVNGAVAALVRSPGYIDAYYYFNGGVLIAQGRLIEPYFWNWAAAPPSLPAPAFAYWQPLPSLLAAGGILLAGGSDPFEAAQAVYIVLGSLIPVLAYLVAAQIGERRHALIAGLLAAFGGFYAIYWSLPESFTPYALAGGGALWLTGLGLSDSGRRSHWLAAGLTAGLAHLTRADGLLMLLCVLFCALIPFRGRAARRRLIDALLAAAGYLLVMAPWFARSMAVFGAALPPGGLNALWLVEYNDLFNYPSNLSAARYFAAGWETILRVKWEAFTGNLGTFVGVHNLAFLTPFTLIGAWRMRHERRVLPAFLYGLALFAAMTFAFSLVGVRGGFFHSGAALVPFVAPLAVLGLDAAIRWTAQRLPHWQPERAFRGFGMMAVGMAALTTAGLVLVRIVGLPDLTRVAWNHDDDAYREAGDWMDAAGIPADAAVMSNNPPGFFTLTGRGGIPLVNGDEADQLRAMAAYGVRYLIINRHVPEGLEPLYLGEITPRCLTLLGTFGTEDDPFYLYRADCAG